MTDHHDHQRNRPPRERLQRRGIALLKRRLHQRGEEGTDQKSDRRDRIPSIRPGAHPADEARQPGRSRSPQDQFREHQPRHRGDRQCTRGAGVSDAPCEHGQQCEERDRISPLI